MSKPSIKLTVGGPVQAKYGTYLSRPADEQLFRACQAGKFAYVLASRQIGKSSLMFATSERLSQAGVRTALIDLNSIGQTGEADSWYFSLIDELARRLGLAVDVQSWWEKRPRLSTNTQRFLQFLREAVLEEIAEPVVVFVDEIDMTLGLDFTDDFFAAIRSVHNDRAQYPAYHRLTFVLLGVATPDELIGDHTRTPFNIGQAITLRDFTQEECTLLRLELEAEYADQGRQYFDRIYYWTNGHPYLTQKLCAAILVDAEAGEAAESHADLVETTVRNLFFSAEARSDDNLQFVQTRVTRDAYASEMLRTYRRVLESKKPVFDDEQSPAINRLKLYGLVVAQEGELEVRNNLYAHVFDGPWVNEMLRLSSAGVRLGLPHHYKVLQEIGQGGFSTVYLAQLAGAGKTQSVALKVLKTTGVTDANLLRRFKQEARAVAQLEHPNIIQIYEAGNEEEPFFIAMEYIAGGTVRDRLKSGSLPRPEAIEIVRKIGTALSHAHEHGIIHRDVKPENILLDDNQTPVRPVLTDFGLIKLLAADDTCSNIKSSAIMGTLDYMAPEQWRQESLTPATDLYALAITFFEMLTGQRPFESDSGYYDLMNQHLEKPLPRASSVAPGLGTFFDEALLRAAAKKPADRFENVPQFIEALEKANERAGQAELVVQRRQAERMVEVARDYVQRGSYDSEKILNIIDLALDTYPECLDALRLRAQIRLKQGQFVPALEDYRRAYEQTPDPSSEVGTEYLEALAHVAEAMWQDRAYQGAVKHYETIRQVLDSGENITASIQMLWETVRFRLVEYYHHEGYTAYASGKPEDVDGAVAVLKSAVLALEMLEARAESEDLREKQKDLQVRKYQDIIAAEAAAIESIKALGSQVRFNNEDIIQHYTNLDEAYQSLIALEPGNEQWTGKRRENLIELVETRSFFAARAAGKLEPDYEAAIRHYKAIRSLEKTSYPDLSRELNLDLDKAIVDLEQKADHDGKYQEIRQLLDSGDYLKALERLEADFIAERNYEHRDVARLLWGLVYARRHDGRFPPEWESLSGFEVLSKRLVGLERARIQQLKDKLDPWSQARILETVTTQNRRLAACEEELEAIESMLTEAVAYEIAEAPDIAHCQAELVDLEAQIQAQKEAFFQIDVPTTSQQIEAWLQKVADIESLLDTGNPIKDIPEFFNRSDEEQMAIEKDPMLGTLQELVAVNLEIERTIGQLKDRIREQLVRVLIDDVGRRDEDLAQAREALAQARTEESQAQSEATQARQLLAEVQKREDWFREQLAFLIRRHEFNRYVTPLSLVLALIVGGIVAPRIEAWSNPVIRWTALILLIAYLAYYIWAFYVSKAHNG